MSSNSRRPVDIASSQVKAMIESQAQDYVEDLGSQLRLCAGRQHRRRPVRLVPTARPIRPEGPQGRRAGHTALPELDESAASAVALLALVAGQDVEPAGGSDGRDGRWRIAQKVTEDRVISTVDPDARHTRKSLEARRDGYRAHLAADRETGIITDEKLTRA
jgi:hypothetical protein